MTLACCKIPSGNVPVEHARPWCISAADEQFGARCVSFTRFLAHGKANRLVHRLCHRKASPGAVLSLFFKRIQPQRMTLACCKIPSGNVPVEHARPWCFSAAEEQFQARCVSFTRFLAHGKASRLVHRLCHRKASPGAVLSLFFKRIQPQRMTLACCKIPSGNVPVEHARPWCFSAAEGQFGARCVSFTKGFSHMEKQAG